MLFLVRHGETEDAQGGRLVRGWADVALSASGRDQIESVARRLAPEGPASLYTSHLRRARETADIIGRTLGLSPIVDQRLAESRRGRWESRLVSDIKKHDRELWRAYKEQHGDFRFPGGESLAEHQARVLAALRDIGEGGPTPAVVVTHAGSIRCAYCATKPHGLRAFRELAVPPGATFVLRHASDGSIAELL